jgi:hypothetical protein
MSTFGSSPGSLETFQGHARKRPLVGFTLPPELIADLACLAEAKGISKSRMAEWAIRLGLDRIVKGGDLNDAQSLQFRVTAVL